MWVKLDVLDNPYTIAGGLSGGTGLTNGYAIQIYSASGLVYFRLGNGSANTLISGSISAGVWTHILCTYNGTNMQTWINGATDGSTTAVSSPIVYDTSKDLFIGTRYLWGSHILTGNIDEVAIWNSDQSANFATIYNSGKPADLTSLSPSAWWRMGEEAIFDPAVTEWAIPDQAGSNDGVSANMDIYTRVGDAPNSPNNALSYNMDAAAIVEDTPPNP